MSTIPITNNTKQIEIDLKNPNTIEYKLENKGAADTTDKYVNVKFFLNTNYPYNPEDKLNILVKSFKGTEEKKIEVRTENTYFKYNDIFFDKLYKLNTDFMTITFQNDATIGNYTSEIIGVISIISLPIISRIYGSEGIPIKTDNEGRIDISGQTVKVSGITLDASGLSFDISGQTVVVKDLSGHRVDISGQRVDISTR
jgi:hypothetical protein